MRTSACHARVLSLNEKHKNQANYLGTAGAAFKRLLRKALWSGTNFTASMRGNKPLGEGTVAAAG